MKDYLQNLNLHQARENVVNYTRNTACAIAAGSILSVGDPRSLAIALVAKDVFQKVNWTAVNELPQKLGYQPLLDQQSLMGGHLANLALSIIVGKQIAAVAGFEPSYFGMMSGMLCSSILQAYLASKKVTVEEADTLTQNNPSKVSQNTVVTLTPANIVTIEETDTLTKSDFSKENQNTVVTLTPANIVTIEETDTLTKSDFSKENQNTVVTVTAANFEEEVENSKLPVALDVYAEWCAPCKSVAPIFSELSKELRGQVKFVKFDVEQEKELVEKLDIKGMPTFLFFKEGKQVASSVGFLDREGLLSKINPMLNDAAQAA